MALEMVDRNIDRHGAAMPRALRKVRTFGDPIDLRDQDMHEVEAERRITALKAEIELTNSF
jgi:hypothetical protein